VSAAAASGPMATEPATTQARRRPEARPLSLRAAPRSAGLVFLGGAAVVVTARDWASCLDGARTQD
jgi:hypothetical protein